MPNKDQAQDNHKVIVYNPPDEGPSYVGPEREDALFEESAGNNQGDTYDAFVEEEAEAILQRLNTKLVAVYLGDDGWKTLDSIFVELGDMLVLYSDYPTQGWRDSPWGDLVHERLPVFLAKMLDAFPHDSLFVSHPEQNYLMAMLLRDTNTFPAALTRMTEPWKAFTYFSECLDRREEVRTYAYKVLSIWTGIVAPDNDAPKARQMFADALFGPGAWSAANMISLASYRALKGKPLTGGFAASSNSGFIPGG